VGADITLTFPGDARETCEYVVADNYAYSILLYSPSGFSSDKYTQTLSAKYTESANGYISYTILNNSYNLNGTQYQYTVTPYYKLVPGPSVLTSGVNPLTLYKPSTPGQFTVTNQGSDLLLNWQSSAIATIPVPTLVPNYKVEVSQVTPSGSWPEAKSPQYITGTSTTFRGYNSDAGQLSISLTAIIPGYDQNLSATYINGFTSNKNFTIPNQTNVSIRQDDPANPQVLSVRIPPLAAAWVWFLTTAYGTTTTPRGPYYTCNINTDPTQSLFESYNVTVSTGLYYTVSAYGWFNNFDFPTTNPGSAPVIINANPNPYPATTFNVSYASIKTSHSGTIITVSWAPVAQAAYYDIQEFDSAGVQIGGGGLLLNSPRWVSTVTHTPGSSYKFEITAFTISQASFNGIGLNTGATIDGLAVGAELPNSKNPYFPTQRSSNETLYIPGPVVNLTAVQFLQTVSLTWLQPNFWTPQESSITTTSANTSYFIQQLSGTSTIVVASKTISGGGTPQTFFNISAGRTYTFTVSTTYYGIPTTTTTTTSLTTVNPSITSLTLTDNGNKTITLAGSANTAGDWYANISTGSTAVYPGTATSANTTSFTLSRDVTAGSAWTGFVKFIATLGGIDVSAKTTQLTLPNPTITRCSISDNFTDGTLTLNLSASIGGSGTYTPRWTVPATVGTGAALISLSTSPANSASTIAVYKKALAAQTYSFTGITVSADGFESSISSASYTTPAFTVSQNPAQIIIVNPKTLSATFFSPELTNVGPPRTLSTSLTLSSTISWNFPTSLTNGGTFSSYAPSTGSGIVNVSYSNVGVGTTVEFPANSVSVNYLGYTVSLGSAVSYATPNPTVTVGSTSTRFVDNKNGTLTLFLVAAGCTQGSGNVTWTVPSSVNGNGTAPDALTVSGSPTTLSSASVVYTGAKNESTYTINVGGVSVAYSGYSNSNATSIVSLPVELPQINAITGVYFGCSEDRSLTGTDSITVSVSSSLPNTWTITACSALTLNSSSGQGTTAIQWAFSGGLKTKAYDFTVGSCNVTVTLTKPSANVTPSFSSFNGGATPTGVVSSIANVSGQTFVWFTSNTTLNSNIDTGSSITVINAGNAILGGSITYTLSAASYSNGILGTPSSYNFSVAAIATNVFYGSAQGTNDSALATSNTIVITFKPGGSGSRTYALVSYDGNNILTAPASSLPSGHTVVGTKIEASTTSQSSFTVNLGAAGAKNYYISVSSTTGFGIASAPVKFTYGSCNVPTSSAGAPATTFTQAGAKTYLVAALGAGNGGNGSGSTATTGLGAKGASWTYTGTAVDIIKSGYTIHFVPGYDGASGLNSSLSTNQGTGGAGILNGEKGTALSITTGTGLSIQVLEIQCGGGGGGAARILISSGTTNTGLVELGGGGGGANTSVIVKRNLPQGKGGNGGYNNGTIYGRGGPSDKVNGTNGICIEPRTPANFGTVANSPPATSTCDIYYIVPT
jgi:hypothetical protein